MATRTASYKSVYDPYTRGYVMKPARRRRSRKVSGLGTLAGFGTGSGIKGTVGSVKGVLVTGAIAAGGAIVTQQIFDRVAANWSIAGWKRHLAQIATGVALGILIAKLLKKPKLAAAFAIGPVVAGTLQIFGEVMQGQTAGLGFTAYTPANAFQSMYSPLYGANKTDGLGLNTYSAVGPGAYPGSVPQAPRANAWAMPAQ